MKEGLTKECHKPEQQERKSGQKDEMLSVQMDGERKETRSSVTNGFDNGQTDIICTETHEQHRQRIITPCVTYHIYTPCMCFVHAGW
jgi:hypothetical protein